SRNARPRQGRSAAINVPGGTTRHRRVKISDRTDHDYSLGGTFGRADTVTHAPSGRLLRLGGRERAVRHRDRHLGHRLLRLPRLPPPDGRGARGVARGDHRGIFAGLAVSALFALPVGRWHDRRGPRGLMTAGSCLGTALCLAWARVESLPALYAVWA